MKIADTDDPLAYFDDTFINIIVQQTNLYAKQYLDLQRSTLRKRSRSKELIDTYEKKISLSWPPIAARNCAKTCYQFVFQ